MIRPHAKTAALLGLALLAGRATTAAPPQIASVSPFGVQRGVSTGVTVGGSNLGGNPRLVAPFGFKLAAPAAPGSDAASWKLSVTADPATAVGVYPVRVQTDDGISNPFLFSVGQLPQVAEKEDNSTFETAQTVAVPAVIEGQAAGNDVDYYKFAGKKGQRVVVDAQCARIGSGVDPSIRLTTAGRAFVASADDTPGLVTDARLVATLPEDGDYVVELSDSRYQGGTRPVYRLVVGAVPAAEELYPLGGRSGEAVGLELRGGTLDGPKVAASRPSSWLGVALAQPRVTGASLGLEGPAAAFDVESLPALVVGDLPELREPFDPAAPPVRAAAPVVLNGRIDPAGDEDRFALAVTPGQKLRIEVRAADIGSALDGVLQVLGAGGSVLATADDTAAVPNPKQPNRPLSALSPDPSLTFTVPAATTEITLALRDLGSRGGTGYPYRIHVAPTGPNFELTLTDAQVSVPKGGTAAVGVAVVRKGYNGSVALTLAGPPAGLTFRPGAIAEGQATGVLTVSAAADAGFDPVILSVQGEGKAEGVSVVREAVKSVVFAQQATLPTNTLRQSGLLAAPALAVPVSLETPAAPVEVAHGFGAPVPVKVVRGKDADGAVALSAPAPLPAGVTVSAATVAEKALEGSLTVSTTTDVPLGALSLAFLGKGKIAGAERSVSAPAVTIVVVRPASVELTAAALEIKPGETREVKGKITRKGAFKDPVTVKVNGLPAGLKAEPVTVDPDASEFTLKVAADPKAAPATAAAAVALAFQVNKKDYPAPTAPLAIKVLPAK